MCLKGEAGICVLVTNYEDLSQVKLIDFGFDFGLTCHDSMKPIEDFKRCGTLLYKPPEQVTNIYAYSKKADMWSAGVMMYELIVGRHPLWESGFSKSKMELKLKEFSGFKYPKRVSPQARHLIDSLC